MSLPTTALAVTADQDAFATAVADEVSAAGDAASSSVWGLFDQMEAGGAKNGSAESVAAASAVQAALGLPTPATPYINFTGKQRRGALNFVKAIALAIRYQWVQAPMQLKVYTAGTLPTSGIAEGAVAVRKGDASMPGSQEGLVVFDGSAWHNAAGGVVT